MCQLGNYMQFVCDKSVEICCHLLQMCCHLHTQNFILSVYAYSNQILLDLKQKFQHK